MLTRLTSLLAILATTTALSDTFAANTAGPTFVITQVQYTDANQKVQTVMFDAKGMAQIPAIAVKNTIIIGGTYTPADPAPMFAGNVTVANPPASASGVPTLNAGNWTMTINANTFATNQTLNVYTSVNGGAVNTVSINGQVVKTTPVTLTISAN